MPQDDRPIGRRNWFTTPQIVKQLFDKFPLVTCSATELPQRTTKDRCHHALYVFAREQEAVVGNASFNPSCLKWQTYLKFANVDFVTVSSSNHASPTGSLPFLLPAHSNPSSLTSVAPVPSNKLHMWTLKNATLARAEPSNMRYEAYTSLFAHGLRNAWLHTLYLSPHNFESVAYPLYIVPSTTSSILRTALSHTLRSAALHEIRKQAVTRIIDVESLYAESDKAFSALADLLGEDEWFFGENHPSLFDASVFAYTYLLLDENMGWKVEHERMGRDLREGRWENLIAHRGRIWKEYF